MQSAHLSYSFNNDEPLKQQTVGFNNHFSYIKYKAFHNLKDVAISKHNALFLTDINNLNDVFADSSYKFDIGKLSGTFTLSISGLSVQYDNQDNLFVASNFLNGTELVVSVVPVLSTNLVELRVEDLDANIEVGLDYPYSVYISYLRLNPEQEHRQQFEVDYSNYQITFKTKTKDGYRYISKGLDGYVRANGLMFNDFIVNSYLFNPSFITPPSITLGFNPGSYEVKYYNDLESLANNHNLKIKESYKLDTNFLVSCATESIVSENQTPINIAHLRTNFTSTGTFIPVQT
jgi:hypothetical protein